VREDVLSSFTRLVAHTPELQAYTVQKLYAALRADVSQEALTLAGVWMIGEFGDVLLQGGNFEEEELVREVSSLKNIVQNYLFTGLLQIKEPDVLDLMDLILASPYANNTLRQFVLTSITKLSTRFSADTAVQSRIRSMLDNFGSSPEVEIQQRAVEFSELLKSLDGIRVGVLERMPPPELKATVMGTVSEKRAVGSTRRDKDVSQIWIFSQLFDHLANFSCRRYLTSWVTSHHRPFPSPRPQQTSKAPKTSSQTFLDHPAFQAHSRHLRQKPRLQLLTFSDSSMRVRLAWVFPVVKLGFLSLPRLLLPLPRRLAPFSVPQCPPLRSQLLPRLLRPRHRSTWLTKRTVYTCRSRLGKTSRNLGSSRSSQSSRRQRLSLASTSRQLCPR
jgi:hypothetical protein